ncbi:amidase family protein [Herbiconiux moechotypicola]|uniref:Amidase n=1 Tax=Herbiconiux moechotypicola TaxID=637393 RepID=A0ABP5QIE2_9MICO|nr:amidase family protein [Herbiconiux moechotypicola]MCS5729981.1 amidase family protein [Herbiconiux moechotypicola]
MSRVVGDTGAARGSRVAVEELPAGFEITAALRRGDLSAVEVVTERISRIDSLDPLLGALTDRDLDSAVRAAERLDRDRARGVPQSPLAGWPVTVKDSFDVAGFRTTVGRASDARMPEHDAPVVRRLRDSGAIILGKTNVPVMLDDYQSSNADFGVTRNPWDPSRSPGGSSGGAAVAVSSGMSVADLGSDLYGSIRMPAAWCGIYGHRPTNGLISKLGHMPGRPDARLEPSLSTVGPMADHPRDLLLLFQALVGLETPVPAGRSLVLPAARHRSLRGIRIGLWIEEPSAPIDEETGAAFAALAGALRDAGCVVTELRGTPLSSAATLELLDVLKDIELAHNLEPAAGRGRLDVAAVWAAWEQQQRLSERWTGLFDTLDFVVAPATFGAAPPLSEQPEDERWVEFHGTRTRAMDFHAAWSKLTNVPRAPATVVPIGLGRESRLPIGAQIMGPYLADLSTLQLAVLLEEEGVVGARQLTRQW